MEATRHDRLTLMRPGHEDCPHETIEEKALMDPEPRVITMCLHEHREPVLASDGLDHIPVGFHCHCCGNVWNNRDYIERGTNA